MKVKCLVCKGTGKVELPLHDELKLKKQATHLLYKAGYGIRQIQRLLGYKSPRSISRMLIKYRNNE